MVAAAAPSEAPAAVLAAAAVMAGLTPVVSTGTDARGAVVLTGVALAGTGWLPRYSNRRITKSNSIALMTRPNVLSNPKLLPALMAKYPIRVIRVYANRIQRMMPPLPEAIQNRTNSTR